MIPSMSGNENKEQAQSSGAFVSDLNDQDVLIGESQNNDHPGNSVLLNEIEKHSKEYHTANGYRAKNAVVKKTVEAVKAKRGRFLRKMKKAELKRLGRPGSVLYEVINEDMATEKVKKILKSSGETDKKRLHPAEPDSAMSSRSTGGVSHDKGSDDSITKESTSSATKASSIPPPQKVPSMVQVKKHSLVDKTAPNGTGSVLGSAGRADKPKLNAHTLQQLAHMDPSELLTQQRAALQQQQQQHHAMLQQQQQQQRQALLLQQQQEQQRNYGLYGGARPTDTQELLALMMAGGMSGAGANGAAGLDHSGGSLEQLLLRQQIEQEIAVAAAIERQNREHQVMLLVAAAAQGNVQAREALDALGKANGGIDGSEHSHRFAQHSAFAVRAREQELGRSTNSIASAGSARSGLRPEEGLASRQGVNQLALNAILSQQQQQRGLAVDDVAAYRIAAEQQQQQQRLLAIQQQQQQQQYLQAENPLVLAMLREQAAMQYAAADPAVLQELMRQGRL